jgi:uncharacterized protein YjiS (DUF1127 family)
MNTHANRPRAHHPSLSPMGRVAAWVSTKWRARRAHRLEEETVACLSAMDTKLLNDIGMDIGKLGELTRENPHVSPVSPLTPSQQRRWRKRS